MNLFIFLLIIILILFIPIPIKLSIYYSTVDYYIKIYKITLISKKKLVNKRKNSLNDKPVVKKERKLFLNFYKKVNLKTLLRNLFYLNLKFKPVLKMKLSLDYSLSDAAGTAIFYGILTQLPLIIYIFLKRSFNIKKFNIKVNPIFEDKLLLKIETSSIIFLSFANIIYMTIIFLKLLKQGR